MTDPRLPDPSTTIDPSLDGLLERLNTAATWLIGPGGIELRSHIEHITALLASDRPDDQVRAEVTDELALLIEAIRRLAASQPGGYAGQLTELADALRELASYLSSPAAAQDDSDDFFDRAPPDDAITQIAFASARDRGLSGEALLRAVAHARRELGPIAAELDAGARIEASRARAAADFDRLIESMIGGGGALGDELARIHPALTHAFRRADLTHMAAGLGALAEWLSTPASIDAAAQVDELRATLADKLGPATAGDPGRSDTDRRRDTEQELRAAADGIVERWCA